MTDFTHGTFYWNELMTRDVEAAKSFFASTIGWTAEPFPMEDGTYWVMKSDDQPVGGIMDMTNLVPAEVPAHWLSYLAVDDVDERLKGAVAAGAAVIKEPFDVPGVGRIAILSDPTGAVMGWITPAA